MVDFTTLQKNTIPISDATIAKLNRDPVVNAGSKFLFDFLDPYCNPNADGALTTAAVLRNLVNGGAAAALTSTAAVPVSLAGKAGISITGGYQSGAASRIDLGVAVPTGDHAFVSMFWVKQTGIVAASNQNQAMFSDEDPVGPLRAWAINAGTTGQNPNGIQRNGATIKNTSPVTDGSGMNVVVQYAVGWQPDGTFSFYRNGVLVSAVAGFAAGSVPVSGKPPRIYLSVPGVYYRAYMEDLTVSGRATAAAMAADIARCAGRFT